MEIPFTQYKRPNGNKIDGSFPSDDDTTIRAMALINQGVHFSCEELRTKEISLAATVIDYEDGEVDIACILSENDSSIAKAISSLVIRAEYAFHSYLYPKRIQK